MLKVWQNAVSETRASRGGDVKGRGLCRSSCGKRNVIWDFTVWAANLST
jgi:hypothetical protein